MKIADLNGKKICILGYGREGKAMVEALEKYAPDADITVADKQKLQMTNFKTQSGESYTNNLEQFDVIIISPGVPPHELQATSYKLLTNSTQIFLDTIADSGATTIGVTGSKGKSTTASLIHHILKSAGKKSVLVGNIGEPAMSHISDAGPETIFVMEMSSYQLMHTQTSPHIAVITSLFPEHLDYHGSLGNYAAAKAHITQFQTPDDVVLFYNSPEVQKLADLSPGKKVPVSAEDSPIAVEDTKLLGKHNQGNIALACAVARELGVEDFAFDSFEGLPHRLQDLGQHHGIRWINDSISTTPESAIAALDALGKSVEMMILGGQDRGNDFSKLAKRLAESNVHTVVLMGESGERIGNAIGQASGSITLHRAETLEEAVMLCRKSQLSHLRQGSGGQATPNSQSPICAFSPASPSYDQYKNFEERGSRFAQHIQS